MSIVDELMALPAPDRLAVCLDVYEATKKIRDAEHRANALEMLFTAMALTVNEQLVRFEGARGKPPVGRKGQPATVRRKRAAERRPPLTNNGRDELRRWLADEKPSTRRPLSHQPFADALKRRGS